MAALQCPQHPQGFHEGPGRSGTSSAGSRAPEVPVKQLAMRAEPAKHRPVTAIVVGCCSRPLVYE